MDEEQRIKLRKINCGLVITNLILIVPSGLMAGLCFIIMKADFCGLGDKGECDEEHDVPLILPILLIGIFHTICILLMLYGMYKIRPITGKNRHLPVDIMLFGQCLTTLSLIIYTAIALADLNFFFPTLGLTLVGITAILFSRKKKAFLDSVFTNEHISHRSADEIEERAIENTNESLADYQQHIP